MSNALSGKVALVTSGSRGIGAAIVRRLASDGASVAFTYAASEVEANALRAEVEEAGARVLVLKADSADSNALRDAVTHTVSSLHRLDILVNNAGILLRGMADTYDLSAFDRMVAVNLRAVFVAVQAALPHMGGGGRIITTGSVTADRVGFPGASVYGMTKGAIAALTRGLARDLGPRGITVNVVQPGPTETDMNADDDVRTMVRSLTAVGRMGSATEIASLVAFLAGPESSFITGAALTIDGGYLA
jgi:3-oxoacyl-[acyl-carrier protein] reductase